MVCKTITILTKVSKKIHYEYCPKKLRNISTCLNYFKKFELNLNY